jgi:hypothetical protein
MRVISYGASRQKSEWRRGGLSAARTGGRDEVAALVWRAYAGEIPQSRLVFSTNAPPVCLLLLRRLPPLVYLFLLIPQGTTTQEAVPYPY